MNRLFFIALLFVSVCIYAATIKHTTAPGPYYQGTPFAYVITIEGADGTPEVSMGKNEDLQIGQARPVNKSHTSIYQGPDGKMVQDVFKGVEYTFPIAPLKTGQLQIPACTVKVDGETKVFPAETITVREQDAALKVTLSMTADKTTVAVGEPCCIDFALAFESSLVGCNLSLPLFELDGIDCQPAKPEVKNALRTVQLSSQYGVFPAALVRDGQQMKLCFRAVAVFHKAGEVTVGKPSALCTVEDTRPGRRRASRSPFSSFFDEFETPTVQCSAIGEAILVTVKEPPLEGRPASYTGLAEACTISAKADKTDVFSGDPITLTITIKGPRFLKSVILPKLSDLPAFKDAFRVYETQAVGEVDDTAGTVTFVRTIRPTTEVVTAIPPVELSWFDAADGKYHTARTASIPITVKHTDNATAVSATPVGEKQVVRSDVVSSGNNLKGNFLPEECMHARQRPARVQQLISPREIIILSSYALACMLLWGLVHYRRYRKMNATAYRKRRADKTAARLLAHAKAADQNAFAEILKAISTFFAERMNRAADAITLQDEEDYLETQQAPAELLDKLKSLTTHCENAIYAKNVTLPAEQALEQAYALIEELGKKRKPTHPTSTMKTMLFFIFASASVLAAPTRLEDLQQAETLYRQALQAKATGDFSTAATALEQTAAIYREQLRTPENENARIHCNLANVLFAQNHLGLAIRHYCIAQELEPGNNRITDNLALARAACKDAFPADESSQLVHALCFFHYDLSVSTRVIAFCSAFALCFLAIPLCALIPSRKRMIRVIAGLCAIVFLVLGTSIAVTRLASTRQRGTITATSVNAKTGNALSYPNAFEKPLHDGTEFQVINQDIVNHWLFVQLPNGEQCWLPESAVTVF